jgi:hypothetical protein
MVSVYVTKTAPRAELIEQIGKLLKPDAAHQSPVGGSDDVDHDTFRFFDHHETPSATKKSSDTDAHSGNGEAHSC